MCKYPKLYFYIAKFYFEDPSKFAKNSFVPYWYGIGTGALYIITLAFKLLMFIKV